MREESDQDDKKGAPKSPLFVAQTACGEEVPSGLAWRLQYPATKLTFATTAAITTCRQVLVLPIHAHDLKLVPSTTAYTCRGKGPKQRLRFTKTGEGKLEESYARHFVWIGKGPFHPPAARHEARPELDGEQANSDPPSWRDD